MASYAVILRRSALVTAIPALVMVVLGGALGGGKGLAGALLGVGLVIVFFGISAAAMSWASRKSPQVTVVVCVVVWTSAQALVSARLKVPYVEPDGKR